MIKKILFFSCLIILIPYIIVTIFIRDDEITFNFSSNSIIRVKDEDTNNIARVAIEEYVVGVVAGEMPIEFELEALKAQAVAARSYVMIQKQRNINNDYDVVDTVLNQVYLDRTYLMNVWEDDYTNNINKIKKAVLSTKGEYISYKGKVAEALFFSTSPGVTEDSEDVFSNKIEYLRSVDSSWDKISPAYNTSATFSLNEFYNLLNLKYDDNLNVEVIDKTKTGRIKKIKINNIEFTSKEVCSKLKLKSTYFEIVKDENKVIIKNKGYGHGVGMSQYGAQGMALEGYTYDEILKHYYTGIEIKKF
ncbi:MAG: stage II sporulation protein D [bacterium]|nr:stage II sporulation protein D [bacterium]